MNWFQALILGVIQGLTEYLPVSSSGHLAILANIFEMSGEENLTFTVMLHVATVCSTLVVLKKETNWILKDLFRNQNWHSVTAMNSGTRYVVNILISMIPIGIVGLFFKDKIEHFFGSGLFIVGIMLLLTSMLLSFAYYAKPTKRRSISPLHAFIIGVAQAFAVMPGLSRSGSTIATGLLLGNRKDRLAQFSFLMVIPPILGEALLDVWKVFQLGWDTAMAGISPLALLIGFISAFITGCLACKWMINIVKNDKLIYFAVYCAVIGILSLCFS